MSGSRIKNGIAMLFGILILSITPAIVGSSAAIQPALAQNATTPTLSKQNTTAAQVNEIGLPMQEGFSVSVLATNFSAPHNILYGPDGVLWITERVGKNIMRVDPNTGDRLSVMRVPNVHQSGGQDGLLGMAFDPDFNNTNHIYVAYTYDADASEGEDRVDRRLKITRFTYNPEGQSIGDPMDLISGLSGSNDHNGGGMIFGPDGKLYYTIGDQGNNQFERYCMPIRAQLLPTTEHAESENWTAAYQGKVLRMNPDGSIPEDNPEIDGVQSHIFTYGHRNHQGIAIGPNGDLYVVEHGDKSDDEVNRLEAGGNYGWPNVAGYNDDKAYQYANWSGAENCPELEFNNIPPFLEGVPVINESGFNDTDFVPPVRTFYTVENDYNFSEPADCGYVCWPTVAPSSITLYMSDAIPNWNGTFLMTTLKGGRIFHLTLSENGTSPGSEPEEIFRSENRYHDLAFGPDGQTIYVITDSSGPVQAIEGGPIANITNPGSLLAFKYEGSNQTMSNAGPVT
ncbi:MAG: glucose/sorbosone family PQQ-dependent dehydrogenase [Thermoproteota archaeon]